jgi:hypothetical protein
MPRKSAKQRKRRNIMEIKTITAQTPTEFDKAVNEALAEGWELKRRDVLPPGETMTCGYPRLYYAELEKRETEAVPKKHGCYNCRYRFDSARPGSNCFLCKGGSYWEAAK